MSFVTPALLAGALLVAIPVALHLVMRRQPQHVMFPALRFVKRREEANRRRLNLRHLVLLILRCAAIILLALALARPTIQGSGLLGGQAAPVAAVFLFDTHLRMDYRHQSRTRLEQARQMGLELLAQLPRDSQVAVLDTQNRSPVFSVDTAAAVQRMERLEAAATAQPLAVVLQSALELLATSDKPRREIYVFSDLARQSWPDDAASSIKQQLEGTSHTALYVIDVGVENPRNCSLDDARLSAQSLAAGTALRITADAVCRGPDTQRAIELYLLDRAGEARKRGHIMHVWTEGAPQEIVFPPLSGLAQGTHQGYVQVQGEDSLTWDDKRYFTVDVAPPWPVLIVAAEPARSIYLTEALAPEPLRAKGQARFQCDVVPFSELADQPLSDYAAVALLDPPSLPDETWRQLADYAAAGYSVAIFLGRAATPIEAFHGEQPQRLLPSRLKRQWRETTYLAPDDTQHPILAAFRAVEGMVPWKGFPIFRYWQLDTVPDGIAVIARYATSHPALLERRVGQGLALTMTTPISDASFQGGTEPWNLLPRGPDPWPFLVLANEMMLYAVGNRQERLVYFPGETVQLRMDAASNIPMFMLTTPRGDHLRQATDARQSSIAISSTDVLGNYRIRAGGESAGLDRGFSVNLPPRSTRLERMEHDALGELLGKDHLQIARTREQIDRNVNVGRVGRELFPFAILLLAGLLAAEYILSNRFYRQQL